MAEGACLQHSRWQLRKSLLDLASEYSTSTDFHMCGIYSSGFRAVPPFATLSMQLIGKWLALVVISLFLYAWLLFVHLSNISIRHCVL
jgi:hypothetical protein